MGTFSCSMSRAKTALTGVVVGWHLAHGYRTPRPLLHPSPPEAAYTHTDGLRACFRIALFGRPFRPSKAQ